MSSDARVARLYRQLARIFSQLAEELDPPEAAPVRRAAPTIPLPRQPDEISQAAARRAIQELRRAGYQVKSGNGKTP